MSKNTGDKKPRKKRGPMRPATIGEREISLVLDNLGRGQTLKQACENAGVCQRTFKRYRNKDPQLDARVKEFLSGGKLHSRWSELNEFACQATDDEMMSVLRLLRYSETFTVTVACAQVGISTYDFAKYLDEHPEYHSIYRSVLYNKWYIRLRDTAVLKAVEKEDVTMLKHFLHHLSTEMDADSPMLRLHGGKKPEKEEVTGAPRARTFYFDRREFDENG